MNETMLFNKTYGCLAGAATGDALGGHTEGWAYKAIQEKWGNVTGLVEDLGGHRLRSDKGPYTTTDDTHHLRMLTSAMIKKGGRIDAYDLAQSVLDHMDLYVMAGTERELYKKICSGMPLHKVGVGQFQTPTPCFQSPPIGMVNACDPYGAAKDAYELYALWVEGIAQEAPMAVVAAVAEAFKPSATRESIIEAAKAHTTPEVRSYIERAIEVASRFDNVYEAIPTFLEELVVPDGLEIYAQHLADFGQLRGRTLEQTSSGGSPVELMPVALAFFHIGNGDATAAMCGASTFGRDCDGIASIAGAITGAWKGTDALDMDMVSTVDNADLAYYGADRYDRIEVLAEKMQTPMLNAFKEREEGVNSLRALL